MTESRSGIGAGAEADPWTVLLVGPEDELTREVEQCLDRVRRPRLQVERYRRVEAADDALRRSAVAVILTTLADEASLLGLRRSNAAGVPVLLLAGEPPEPDSDALGDLVPAVDGHLVCDPPTPGALAAAMRFAVQKSRLEQQFELLLHRNPDGVIVVDREGGILYANPAAAKLFGRSIDELVGSDFGHPMVDKEASEIELVGQRVAEIRVQSVSWSGQPATLVNLRDVTERKRVAEELQYLAQHDPLTGLFTRARFTDEVDIAVARAARQRKRIALYFIDLDGFKAINDDYGHAAGDVVLSEVAGRLRGLSRASDICGRLGGDEFVLLAEDVDEGSEGRLAERILQQFSIPVEFSGIALRVTASIGIAAIRDASTQQLLKAADAAMYQAKRGGRNQYRFYSKTLNDREQRAKALEGELAGAVSRGEMRVLLQPQMDLTTLKPVAFEVLLRWAHPERGLLAPGDFLDIAERSGEIVEIGIWVLGEIAQMATQWHSDARLRGIQISMNVSRRQLHSDKFRTAVGDYMRRQDGLRGLLQAEIPDSVLLSEIDRTLLSVRELRADGVGVAIDDYGSHALALSVLQQFPIDALKIDGSLIHELDRAEPNVDLVRAVVALAETFGLAVSAENVETQTQLERLRRLGCTRGQGFLFGQPRPLAEIDALLADVARVHHATASGA